MKRNLALRQVGGIVGEHHAPQYPRRDLVSRQKEIEILNAREYEIVDLDTGEVVERIAI